MGYRAATAHPGCGAFATVIGHRPVGDVALLDANFHTCRELTHDGQSVEPAISPDGRWVAYVSGRGYGADDDYGMNEFQSLYVIGLDGHGDRRLTQVGAARPVWSPDSRSIAFITDRQQVDREFGSGRRAEVLIVEARTGTERQSVSLTKRRCSLLLWLDRTHLAESCGGHLHQPSTVLAIDLERGGAPKPLFRYDALTTDLWVPPLEAYGKRNGNSTRLVVKDAETGRIGVVPGSEVRGVGSFSAVVALTSDGNLLWQRHLWHQSYEVFLSRHGTGPPERVWEGHGYGVSWGNNLVDNPAVAP
jgi:hypothetical protein